MTDKEVNEIVRSIELSEELAERLSKIARTYGSSPSEAAEYLVRWALDRMESRPAIAEDRGQRASA